MSDIQTASISLSSAALAEYRAARTGVSSSTNDDAWVEMIRRWQEQGPAVDRSVSLSQWADLRTSSMITFDEPPSRLLSTTVSVAENPTIDDLSLWSLLLDTSPGRVVFDLTPLGAVADQAMTRLLHHIGALSLQYAGRVGLTVALDWLDESSERLNRVGRLVGGLCSVTICCGSEWIEALELNRAGLDGENRLSPHSLLREWSSRMADGASARLIFVERPSQSGQPVAIAVDEPYLPVTIDLSAVVSSQTIDWATLGHQAREAVRWAPILREAWATGAEPVLRESIRQHCPLRFRFKGFQEFVQAFSADASEPRIRHWLADLAQFIRGQIRAGALSENEDDCRWEFRGENEELAPWAHQDVGAAVETQLVLQGDEGQAPEARFRLNADTGSEVVRSSLRRALILGARRIGFVVHSERSVQAAGLRRPGKRVSRSVSVTRTEADFSEVPVASIVSREPDRSMRLMEFMVDTDWSRAAPSSPDRRKDVEAPCACGYCGGRLRPVGRRLECSKCKGVFWQA